VLVAGLVLGAAPTAQSDRALEASRNHFNANRQAYGIGDPLLSFGSAAADRCPWRLACPLRPVLPGPAGVEGEAITTSEPDGTVTVTNSLRAIGALDTTPRVNRNAAQATALGYISPLGSYEVRDTSLWVLPRGDRSIVDRLAWHVAVKVENEFEDPAEWEYFIDARTGAVAFAYNDLETGAVNGTANTMYTGSQPITVDQTATTPSISATPAGPQRRQLHVRHAERSGQLLLHHRQYVDVR